MNLWTQEIGGSPKETPPAIDPIPDASSIEDAVALIKTAKAPMIIVGGGGQGDAGLIRSLATQIDAPVLAFRTGHGIMPSTSDHSISMPVGHSLWKQVDLVIGLGTRLQSQVMAWGCDEDLKIIHIDIDKTQLGRSAPVDVAIHAKLGDALPNLLAALGTTKLNRKDWMDNVVDTKRARHQEYQAKLGPQLAWLNAIRDVLPEDGIFVDELTQTGYVSRFAFPSTGPRRFISTGYQGTLGYGFATALGVAHARRDVPVVAISGDGGALFTITELATAVHHNIPLTTVIFNDNAFGNVRRLQMDNYDSRFIASDLSSPDFVQLASSFGAQGLRATTPDGLRRALEKGFAHNGPTVIEVPVGELPSPWEFVLMPKCRG